MTEASQRLASRHNTVSSGRRMTHVELSICHESACGASRIGMYSDEGLMQGLDVKTWTGVRNLVRSDPPAVRSMLRNHQCVAETFSPGIMKHKARMGES